MTESDAQMAEYRKLIALVDGAKAALVVRAAAEMGIADAVGSGESAVADVAERTGIPAERLVRLLRALASLGVCAEVSPGTFTLTAMGSLLRRDRPDSANDLVRMFTDPAIILGAWPRLEYSVCTGQPAFDEVFGTTFFQYLAEQPALTALFNVAMGRTT